MKRTFYYGWMFFAFILIGSSTVAQEKITKDSIKKATKELPLEPKRTVTFTTNEGTWMSLDVSPDGKSLLFDMMGDIYILPAEGGVATRVTEGMAYDVHPRYSPDGKSIVFISDKSGSDNIWTMELATKESKQLTKDTNQNFFSADWTHDGTYIVASKGRRNAKMYLYHKDGGSGAQLISEPANLKVTDPAFSPDGKTLYFSHRMGAWNYNAQLPQYQVGTYDMENGELSVITSRYGSAFTPTPSPDGKWLVYGSRFETETGLVIRNLQNGDERWLAYPVQRDEQESIAPLGVLPAMAFTPDSKFLFASYGGKIYRISTEGSAAVEVPFTANLSLDMGPQVYFQYPIEDAAEAQVTQIRDAVPSPDGKKLAFTALNRLYVMDFPNGTPKRLTTNNFTEAHPAWSPDGKQLVFTTWKNGGGHLYKVSIDGKGRPVQLTKEPGAYTFPAWSYQSNRIAFHRGTAQNFDNVLGMFSGNVMEDLVWVDSNGGAANFIAKSKGRTQPHFTKVDDRLYLSHAGKGLVSIRWDGTDEKEHLSLTGIVTYGSSDVFNGDDHSHDVHGLLPTSEEGWRENNTASRPSEIRISPDATHALAKINNDVYSVLIPRYGKTPKISLAKAESAAFPSRKLTVMGGEFPTWSGDSKKIHWSLGASHFRFDLEAAKKFDDSLALAKKEEKERKEAEKKNDTVAKGEEVKESKKETAFKAEEFKIKLTFQKAIPNGSVLLKGARIITMKGDQVIENGDLLIENNRIKAIGTSGSLSVPSSAQVIEVKGKTIVPGFVDTHAHMWPTWTLHKNQVWMYSANLAYGVTTTRDPQTATTDVLTYADMVDAGMIHGPRVYSTGPGVGFWQYKIESLEHAKDVLKQYSEYYNTKSIKMYLVGNRQQRQWVIMAAKELKLMPTTEGGLDFKLNMTQLLDGYPGMNILFLFIQYIRT